MFNAPSGHSYKAEYYCSISSEKSVLDISLARRRVSTALLLFSHHLECSMGLLTSFQQTCQVILSWKVTHFWNCLIVWGWFLDVWGVGFCELYSLLSFGVLLLLFSNTLPLSDLSIIVLDNPNVIAITQHIFWSFHINAMLSHSGSPDSLQYSLSSFS